MVVMHGLVQLARSREKENDIVRRVCMKTGPLETGATLRKWFCWLGVWQEQAEELVKGLWILLRSLDFVLRTCKPIEGF